MLGLGFRPTACWGHAGPVTVIRLAIKLIKLAMRTKQKCQTKTTLARKESQEFLASVRASVGALSLSGEPGQHEKTWKLWRDRFIWATWWMASQWYQQAQLTVISRRRRAAEATPNTARTAHRLQIANRNVGSTHQGESQQHLGVV